VTPTMFVWLYLLVGLGVGVWCLPILQLKRAPVRVFVIIVIGWPVFLARAIARNRR